jgi:sulfur relay (sulfurtransferase) complex TusBCD TusD component (DsrE family)
MMAATAVGRLRGADSDAARLAGGYPDWTSTHLRKMLGNVLRRGGRVLVCGTCMDARGLTQDDLIEGATRSTMDELTRVTLASDKVLVF